MEGLKDVFNNVYYQSWQSIKHKPQTYNIKKLTNKKWKKVKTCRKSYRRNLHGTVELLNSYKSNKFNIRVVIQ